MKFPRRCSMFPKKVGRETLDATSKRSFTLSKEPRNGEKRIDTLWTPNMQV